MSEIIKPLILIGGGGHCRSCIDVIEVENKYSIKGILDQQDNVGKSISGYKILGTDSEIAKYVKQDHSFLITVGQIGNSSLRKKLYQLVLEQNGLFATIISPRAYVAKNSLISNGSIIMHDALVNTNTTIGENCIINSKALVEHDCNVLPHSHISTAAVLNGGVTIGEGTFFGSNAVSKQGINVEDDSFIKANSCFVGPKRKRIAFLTTIFPTELKYIAEFFESLSKQIYKKFDVIVLNDGFQNFENFKKKYRNLTIIELPAAGSIAKNRETLIRYSKMNNYDIAIFGDIDDTFSEDRIEKSIKALKHADIVVNDLTSIKDGCIIDESIYSKRLINQRFISFDFIKDKNIFGMSNTAVNLNVVSLSEVQFSDDLIAVDWFFFSLLLLNGAKATFISDTVTFYRQYDSNVIGIGSFSIEKINSILKVKVIHYEKMKEINADYQALLDEVLILKEICTDETELNKLLIDNSNEIKTPFWWELIDFRNKK
jgi:sugar O-acyltransferase (sialic acid O-acetyltransferase NeuD family)